MFSNGGFIRSAKAGLSYQMECPSQPAPLYEKLQDGQIRLAELDAGSWKSELQCRFSPVPLHHFTGGTPKFKVLSYVWGSSRQKHPITINGRDHLITTNLDMALRRVRQRYGQVTLWVDAICINQMDLEEKSSQVAQMQSILSAGDEVIIYLGESPDVYAPQDHVLISQTSVSRFPATSSPVRSMFAMLEDLNTTKHDAREGNSEQLCWPDDCIEALRQMLRRPWWNRMWTLQESVVPGKSMTVVYSSHAIAWHQLEEAARVIHGTDLSKCPERTQRILEWYTQKVLQIADFLLDWQSHVAISPLSLLRAVNTRKTSDLRDKIFSLHGLARGWLPRPNYNLSLQSVFRDTVVFIMESTGSLVVLAGNCGSKTPYNLPSWMPDWADDNSDPEDVERKRCVHHDHYQATPRMTVWANVVGTKERVGLCRCLEA